MWARAAVALRNINICEMPSHDAYLGEGLGQGARGACASGPVPFAVYSSLAVARGSLCPLVFRRCQAWTLRGRALSALGEHSQLYAACPASCL